MPRAAETRHKQKAEHIISRLWKLLRALPQDRANAMTLAELQERLDYPDKKSIERDAKKLKEVLPHAVVCDRPAAGARAQAHRWWRKRDAAVFVTLLSTHEAIALKLAERFLGHALPASVAEALTPTFREASRVLGQLDPLPRPTWADKVHFEPPTQPLLPPQKANPAAERVLLEALLRDQQAQIVYRDGAKGSRVVNPLALVYRGPVSYLVCVFEPHEDVRLIALHRVRSAERIDRPVLRPPGFSLQDYLASGALGFGQGEMIRLEARFLGNAAHRVLETKLCVNQEVVSSAQDEHGNLQEVRLVAELPLTQQLEWWLCSFASLVEVIAPESLRRRLAERFAAAARLHAGVPPAAADARAESGSAARGAPDAVATLTS